MDKKEKQKIYYQQNRERIIEKAKEYNKNHKEERQEYNKAYWQINGHKYVEKRKTTVDHLKKYQDMKEYYKEHSKRNYEKYGKDYYIKNKDMINEKYKQYRKDYYLKNQNNIRQKYVNKHYNIFIHNNDNKNFIVRFN